MAASRFARHLQRAFSSRRWQFDAPGRTSCGRGCLDDSESKYYLAKAGFAVLCAGSLTASSEFLSCESCDAAPLNDWRKKWASVDSGSGADWWQLQDVHATLQEHFRELILRKDQPELPGMGPRILVPLCGATEDILFLARQGFRVVGIEGVWEVCEKFANEHCVLRKPLYMQLPPDLAPDDFRGCAVIVGAGDFEGTRKQAPPPAMLISGDFLKIGPRQAAALVPFEAAYDRCGLTVVQPANRSRYAAVLNELLLPGGRVLLVALERPKVAQPGGSSPRETAEPPFELLEADVRSLFSSNFEVRMLSRGTAGQPSLGGLCEVVYLLQKHGTLPPPPSPPGQQQQQQQPGQ
eukprot:TRINITY_DN19154_c1_g3_i1.p1 TRINITY_DN19154_c1_g3~~TRINITY_DN19154_c1_g3_i1.p1  ORF type:complete len:351 (-),score=63.16 TRINITY_DN19154_c1_g3_i1:116-1168(-)